MKKETKEELLKKLFEDFKNELTFDNIDLDEVILNADGKEHYAYQTPHEKPYETYLKHALAEYLSTWAEDWGND